MRRFGDREPEKIANRQAYIWLSRGLYEALEAFVRSCEPGRHALRIAAYEFHYSPFLALLKETLDKGVDIQIVYDGRKKAPGDANRAAVQQAGLEGPASSAPSRPPISRTTNSL